jgi:phospholipase/carboxylesterase
MNNAVILETGQSPQWAVIWLHGLGADGRDFEPIVPELITAQWPAMRFVFPHADVRPVTINGGMQMRAWYDITAFDRKALGNAPGMRDSIARVHLMLDQLIASGIASERIFLVGFSQGGAIAYAAGLRCRHPLAGIAGLSTYLPLSESLADEAHISNAQTPVFAAHGQFDPVVPMDLGEDAAKALRERGLVVQWQVYPMQHSVCGDEILALRVWMQAAMNRSD